LTTLIKIKRLLIDGKYRFSNKASNELRRDGFDIRDAVEAILNAPAITKRIVSHDPFTGKREYLYIISGPTYQGQILYNKGKFVQSEDSIEFNFLISSKRDISE